MLSFAATQLALRMFCVARIYGVAFAAAVPVRAVWGNVLNFLATVAALHQFVTTALSRTRLQWRKTEHAFPGEYSAHLARSQRVNQEILYQKMSIRAGLPFGMPPHREVNPLAARCLPAANLRRWNVLPYSVAKGQSHVLTVDLPSPPVTRELAGLSRLALRFRLVRPLDLDSLARLYLPPAP